MGVYIFIIKHLNTSPPFFLFKTLFLRTKIFFCYNRLKYNTYQGMIMHLKTRKAFTMLELTFVIVVIGILSAIALPRFGDASDSAYITSAQSTLATAQAAITTERQRRILRGDFATNITDLGDGVNAFSNMSAGGGGVPAVAIFRTPIVNCPGGGGQACWSRTAATTYSYFFPKAADGQANYRLLNNRLECVPGAANEAQCRIITP